MEDVIVPPLIKEMVDKLTGFKSQTDEKYAEYLAHQAGWIGFHAEKEYALLVKRDGIPADPRIISLLCELSVTRALVIWYEYKDKPPPRPSLENLCS